MLASAACIDDPRTRLVVEAERSFLQASGGGCRAPVGALAAIVGDEIDLLGGYAAPDGTHAAVAHRRGRLVDRHELGRQLARELDAQGRTPSTAEPAGAGA
jgi:hydroxymethylbilane synthase